MPTSKSRHDVPGRAPLDFVAIDFETSCHADGRPGGPWQLGAAFVRGGEVADTAEWFFKSPERPDAPSFMDQWSEIFPALSGSALVAHNIATERTILTKAAPLTRWGPWIDTLQLARARFPGLPGYSLGELCGRLSVVPAVEGRTWHDGLFDAVACARLALVLLPGRNGSTTEGVAR